MEQRITVAIRIRPPLEKEKYEPLCAHRADDGQTVIIKNEDSITEPATFQFDDVYDLSDDQCGIYEQSVQELVDHTLQGANSTVLTYGQTGSGKTYTILGSMSNGNITEASGIFPRVFHDLFSYRAAVEKEVHIIIFLSAVELYVEDVMDLLAQRNKIKLRETPEETITPGINIVEVSSMEDVMQSFKIANTYRSVTSTKMNDSSSRSHAIFFIDIFQIPIKASVIRPTREKLIDANGIPINGSINGLIRSRMALVDLAGSERVKRSGVEGQAMIEAQAINKSLSALGTTINAMYMESNHIPFRESKLTKLLKPSFIDRTSKLLLIGQIAPPSSSAQESQGTLRFCDRVKGLKAGKVTGFIDPEEEERYLRSVRQYEELTADLRIARVQFYYQPQRPSAIANIKGISVTEARNISISALQKDGENIEARKEAEYIKSLKVEIEEENHKKARDFAEKVNEMIIEYEGEAREFKRNKKEFKRLNESLVENEEIKLNEAKKVKKHRLKLEEKVQKLRQSLNEVQEIEKEIDGKIGSDFDQDKIETQENRSEEGEDNEKDKMTHMLVECFYTHATELSHFHDLYAQRLAATQRQRSQVRRMKLLSSDIIMESTLVYDIIDFVIDRAVDISDGVINPSQRYSWHDIDGISSILRNGEQWYPPLITEVDNDVNEISEPTVFHNITFLSSDDSDAENSHYPNETRRRSHNMSKIQTHKSIDRNSEGGSSKDSEASDTPPTREANTLLSGKDIKNNQEQQEELKSPKEIKRKEEKNSSVTLETGVKTENNGEGLDENDEDDEDEEEAICMDADGNASGEPETEVEKQRRRSRQDQEYLMRVYDSSTLVQDLIKFLRGGTVMLKHGRSGKPHRRLFWVSIVQSRRKLLWMDPDAKATTDRSSVSLDDVSYIQLGCFSKVFKRHPVTPTDPSFYRSFTVGLKDGSRTVDIVADTVPDFEAWVIGLSNLVRVDPVWGGKLDIVKETNFGRLNCFEASLCESNYIYPTQYVMLKKRVNRIAAKTLSALQQCGNDVEKAHKLLHGIHPPAINEKGAVYLTKGELRFIARNEMDIMRITKIWMMFQQMNLVFDDNFIPATTFGVTQRH